MNATAAQYAAAISSLDNPRLGGGGGERESNSYEYFFGQPMTDDFANLVLETYWHQARGTWSEASGTLGISAVAAEYPGAILQFVGRESFDDVLVTADTPAAPGNRIMGLVARGSFKGGGQFSGYFVWWRFTGNVLFLERVDDNVLTALGSFVVAPPFFTMELRCVGASIDVLTDDVVRISVADATYTSGFCAVAAANTGALPIHQIRITPG